LLRDLREVNRSCLSCKNVKVALSYLKPEPCPWTFGSYLRLFFVFIVIGLFVTALIMRKELGIFLGPNGPMRKFVANLGWIAPVAYASIYVVCTVFMVPGTVLTLAAGILFHELWLAFVTISVGSTIGDCCSFLLGKTVLRSWVVRKIDAHPLFKAVDVAITRRGLVMVLLLRLTPVLPFNVLNYGLSVTGISFLSYAYGSWVGMAPGTFMYIYLSWAALNAATSTGQAKLVSDILTYGVGSVVTIMVVVIVTIISKRAIDLEMDKIRKEREPLPEDSNNDDETNT